MMRAQLIPIGLLLAGVAAGGRIAIAQIDATPAELLAAPALHFHASLLRYFRSGPPIENDLMSARDEAKRRGIRWQGLHLMVNDEINLAGITHAEAVTWFKRMTCAADAVAVGHVTTSASHLSAWGSVYTDYAFDVDTVLKDRQGKIGPKATIVVTRPGGYALIGDNPVTFEFSGFPTLKTNVTYLQFLSFIPESTAYQPLDAFATLVLEGSESSIVRPSSAVALPGLGLGSLEAAIDKWLASCAK